MRIPLAAVIQLIPNRVPMTPIDGDNVGGATAAAGTVTRTPDMNPQIIQNTIKPASLCMPSHENVTMTAATVQNTKI